MTTDNERLLQEFVDRKEEIRLFRDILETGSPPVMVVCGEDGVGKTALLARMIHECAQRKLPKSQIVWRRNRNYDYLGIMRTIRDDVKVEYFNKFNDLVNYYTVPQYQLQIRVEGSVNVLNNARIEGSTTGDIIGVNIEDVMYPETREDLGVPKEEKIIRLTDLFIDSLSNYLQAECREKPLVVFLDAVQNMTEDTRRWVLDELLGAVRNNDLGNIRFVLSGGTFPTDDLDRGLRLIMKVMELGALERKYIVEYLEKRGIRDDWLEPLSVSLMASTRGNLQELALQVDTILETIANEEA